MLLTTEFRHPKPRFHRVRNVSLRLPSGQLTEQFHQTLFLFFAHRHTTISDPARPYPVRLLAAVAQGILDPSRQVVSDVSVHVPAVHVRRIVSPNPPKRWSLALTPWMMGKGRRTGLARIPIDGDAGGVRAATPARCWRPCGHAGGIRQAVGRKCPWRTELVRVGGDVQLAGWRVSGLVAAVRPEMAGLAIERGRD